MKKILSFLGIFIIFLSGCVLGPKFLLDEEFYNKGEFREITSKEFEKLENQNYVLFTFNNFCALSIPCEDIFKDFMEKYQIDFISMKYDEFKKTSLHDTVQFAPSVIIVHNGKIISYLDSEKDKDIEKYQDVEVFEKWIKQYIKLEK